jgi:hypothetical protein
VNLEKGFHPSTENEEQQNPRETCTPGYSVRMGLESGDGSR